MSAYPAFRQRTARTKSESINWVLDLPTPLIQNMGIEIIVALTF